uniref:Proline--tRNA ligase n=1 Tax=uncultured Elusimicrobia bacterium TaxID=699876 RepID=A0A650ELL0_9BACT|nr:proline--tRNA ligase [uncultured Elusimicrobia bacterium]
MNSVEKVLAHLAACGLQDRLKTLDESSATVELAAAALGCKPELIAKTLSFDVNGKAVLIVAAGDAKVDNAKFKAFFGQKAAMIKPDQVEEMTGFIPGGVCPFAPKEGVNVYLDVSLKRFESIYPAGGSRNTAVQLTPAELEAAARPKAWVDLCKNWA